MIEDPLKRRKLFSESYFRSDFVSVRICVALELSLNS